jgi:hypothetical protein
LRQDDNQIFRWRYHADDIVRFERHPVREFLDIYAKDFDVAIRKKNNKKCRNTGFVSGVPILSPRGRG